MTEYSPITPPLELVRQWQEDALGDPTGAYSQNIATRAAQWGADQKLDQLAPNAPTVEDLQAQIHALRADYLRMANAVANQLPYRTKFFADLMPSSNEHS